MERSLLGLFTSSVCMDVRSLLVSSMTLYIIADNPRLFMSAALKSFQNRATLSKLKDNLHNRLTIINFLPILMYA